MRQEISGRARLARAAYLKTVGPRFRSFSLEGLARSKDPIPLRNIYVDQKLGEAPVDDSAEDAAIEEGARSLIDWLEIRRSLVIIGPPGSGKTTLVNHTIATLSSSAMGPLLDRYFDYLPIPLVLRHRLEAIDALDDEADLWPLVEGWFDEIDRQRAKDGEASLDREALREFRDGARLFVLLDGFDEVGNLPRREKLARALARSQRGDEGSVFLLTSRPPGIEGFSLGARHRVEDAQTDGRSVDAAGLHLRPFSTENIEDFCRRWFDLPGFHGPEHEELRDALIETLKSEGRRDLRLLARRPAFLTLIAFVQATLGRLPDTRASLYEMLVEAYLHSLDAVQRRDVGKLEWPYAEKRALLSALALAAHEGTRGEGEDDRRFTWKRSELPAVVKGLIEKSRVKRIRPEDATDYVEYLLARSGLLVEAAEGQVQFAHLSFQEYLAAVALHAKVAKNKVGLAKKHVFAHLGQAGADEVATLFMAIDGEQTQHAGHDALLGALDLKKDAHLDWLATLLGGKEIELCEAEREAWVGVLWTTVLTPPYRFDRFEALDRHEGNAEPTRAWFLRSCTPYDGASPATRLHDWLGREGQVPKSEDEADEVVAGYALRRFECLLKARKTVDSAEATGAGFLALAVSGADENLDDESLAEAVPPKARQVVDGWRPNLAFWGAHAVARPDRSALLDKLDTEAPAALRLLFGPQEAPGWFMRDGKVETTTSVRGAVLSLGLALSASWGDSTDLSSRARALARARALDRDLDLDLDLDRALARARARALARARARALDRARALARALALARDLALDRALDLALARALDLARDRALALARDLDRDLDRDLALDLALDRALALALDLARALALALALALDLIRALAALLQRFAHAAIAHLLDAPPLTPERLQREIEAWSPGPKSAFDEEDHRQLRAAGIDPIPLFEELLEADELPGRESPKAVLNLIAEEIIQFVDAHLPEGP